MWLLVTFAVIITGLKFILCFIVSWICNIHNFGTKKLYLTVKFCYRMLKGVEDLVNLRFITRTVKLLNRLNCDWLVTSYSINTCIILNISNIKELKFPVIPRNKNQQYFPGRLISEFTSGNIQHRYFPTTPDNESRHFLSMQNKTWDTYFSN